MSDVPGESGGRPSWRDSGGDGAGGDWQRPEGVRSWRRPGDEENSRPAGSSRIRWRQVFKSLAAATVTAGCVALAVWLLLLPGCVQTKLAPVVASIADTPQLPPNLPVAGDLEALKSLDSHNGIRTEFQDTRNDRHVLVIYLSALWVPDARGGVLVMDSRNPRPDDLPGPKQSQPTTQQGFRSLAAYLAQAIGDAPQQNTLVLLDLCQLRTDWRIGVLENDIEKEIQDAINSLSRGSQENSAKEASTGPASKNLAVILSCSRGEHSWASPHLGNGQTAFGFSLREALAGKADEDHNNRLTVYELFRHVGSQTNHWVQQNRDRGGQHPVLVTGDKTVAYLDPLDNNDPLNFPILQVGTTEVPDAPVSKSSPPKANLDTLQKLWAERNALQANSNPAPAFHHDPLRWQELTLRLQRAEHWIFWNQPRTASNELDRARTLLKQLTAERFPGVRSPFVRQAVLPRLVDPLSAPFSLPETGEEVVGPEDHLQDILERTRSTRPGETGDLATRAVQIRGLAERATSGAFGTLHLVQPTLVSADRDRRKAEDLLFVGDKTASTAMQSAETQLQQAMRIRSTLYSAMLFRNRLHSELPDLGRWAASHNVSRPAGHQEVIDDLVDSFDRREEWPSAARVEILLEKGQQKKEDLSGAPVHFRLLALFEQAHLLDRQLASCLSVSPGEDNPAGPGTVLSAQSLKQLQDLVAGAQTGLARLRDALGTEGKRCLGLPDQPESWRDIQDILRHTNLDAATRRQLVQRSISMSRKLGSDSASGGQTKPRPPSSGPGMWHALWAIKVLSLGRVTDDPSLLAAWNSWRSVKEKSDTERPGTLRKLGAEIRQLSLTKRQVVERLAAEVKQQDTVDTARAMLQRADRIARSLPASDAVHVLGGGMDPALALRRFQLAELLFAQAGRYVEDFWQGWFTRAAEACIAGGTSLEVPLFGQRAKELEKLLKQRTTLAEEFSTGTLLKTTSRNPLRFGIHDEATIAVAFTPSAVAPPGLASLRLDLEPNGKNLLTLRDQSAHRLAITATATPATARFTLQRNASLKLTAGSLQSGCPGLSLKALPRIFYRGHSTNNPSLAVAIAPCPPPVFRVSHAPLKKKTGLVSVAGQSQRQAIMFILDCSLSMSYGLANRDDPNKRWTTATERLGEVIKGLSTSSTIKPDVGLIAFGHRVGKTGDTINLNNEYLKKKGTPLQPEIAKDPWKDIEILSSFRPLTAAHLAKTLKDIDDLGPYGATPSLAALRIALGEFQKRRSGGIVVLITDGIYTDPDYNRKLAAIKGAMQASPGVSLQAVLFGQTIERLLNDPTVDPTIKVKDRQQALDTLLASGTGHKFHEAPQGAQLATKLAAAIAPRPYFILDRSTTNKMPRTDRQLGDESPRLQPGNYSIGYESVRAIPFEIRGGEKHQFKLLRGATLRYEPPPERRHLTLPSGRFATVENGMSLICSESILVPAKDSTHSAVFTLCLVGRGEQDIVSRPREILFDIVPTSESTKPLARQKSRTTRWEIVPDRTTPTWKVTVDNWPQKTEATIQALWKSTPTPHDKNRVRVWTEVKEDGAKVAVPLPGFPRADGPPASVELKGTETLPATARAGSGSRRQLVITLTPSDRSPERANGFHEHFGRLLPELVWENGTIVADLEYSSEFICEPGSERLTVTFTWPAKLEFKPKELRVRIIPWADRKKTAVRLTKPLTTRLLDADGRAGRPDDR